MLGKIKNIFKPEKIVCLRLYYSNLKASIGLRVEALYAGKKPKHIPTKPEKIKDITIGKTVILTGRKSGAKVFIPTATEIPKAIPKSPPVSESTKASTRN